MYTGSCEGLGQEFLSEHLQTFLFLGIIDWVSWSMVKDIIKEASNEITVNILEKFLNLSMEIILNVFLKEHWWFGK